jgi:hypothetical protein
MPETLDAVAAIAPELIFLAFVLILAALRKWAHKGE